MYREHKLQKLRQRLLTLKSENKTKTQKKKQYKNKTEYVQENQTSTTNKQ